MGRRQTGSAARDRLLAEARTPASVHHPNIAIIHSLEEHASGHFLTMERIEGRSLSERLREDALARAASLLAIDPQARPTTAAVEAPPSR